MANMFSGNTTKTAPKTFDECIRINAVSENLWTWSERLEHWGKILFFILIIVGIIATYTTAIETQQLLDEVYNQVSPLELAKAGIEIPSVFDIVVDNLLKWGLYAFLEYCSYHVLALLIGALASITQNTIISANVALYKASQNWTSPTSTQTAAGIVSSNPPVQSSNANAVQYVNHGSAPVGMWTCQNCGTHNSLNYGQCKKCGKYKS